MFGKNTKIKKFKTEIGEVVVENKLLDPLYSTRITPSPKNLHSIEQEFVVNQDGAIYLRGNFKKGDKITINKKP